MFSKPIIYIVDWEMMILNCQYNQLMKVLLNLLIDLDIYNPWVKINIERRSH